MLLAQRGAKCSKILPFAAGHSHVGRNKAINALEPVGHRRQNEDWRWRRIGGKAIRRPREPSRSILEHFAPRQVVPFTNGTKENDASFGGCENISILEHRRRSTSMSSLNRHQHSLDGIPSDGGPPHTVLSLIETEDDGRSLDLIIRQLGWEHHRCRTREQAVILLRKHRVSAILLDNSLSVEARRGLVDAARHPGYLPKLVLAYRFSEVRRAPTGAEDGVFLWLWKPFRKDEVRRAIGFALMQCEREWDRHRRLYSEQSRSASSLTATGH